MTKNELRLNPEYYSTSAHLVEEIEEDKRTISMKVLMILIIIGALVLVYNYYIKDDFTKISTSLTDTKVFLSPEMKESIIVQEEIAVSEKVEKIVPLVEIKKDVPIVETVGSSKNNGLSDEYIKLMQKSLGNY